MKTVRLVPIATMALACLAAGTANAALVGVVQSFPDVSMINGTYIVYDHNAVDADSGLFKIVSIASTLSKASGGPAQTQSYAATGDSTADLAMSIQVNNRTGALEGGSVSIGFGNSTTAARFSWAGTITEFGFLGNGKQFDARWTLANDQYRNMPAGFASYTNGLFSNRNGGINITNSAGFGTGNTWTTMLGRDWVFGGSGSTSTITPFLSGLDAIGNPTGRVQASSTVTVDVFVAPAAVPVPGALWLMLSGLGVLLPFARRTGSNGT